MIKSKQIIDFKKINLQIDDEIKDIITSKLEYAKSIYIQCITDIADERFFSFFLNDDNDYIHLYFYPEDNTVRIRSDEYSDENLKPDLRNSLPIHSFLLDEYKEDYFLGKISLSIMLERIYMAIQKELDLFIHQVQLYMLQNKNIFKVFNKYIFLVHLLKNIDLLKLLHENEDIFCEGNDLETRLMIEIFDKLSLENGLLPIYPYSIKSPKKSGTLVIEYMKHPKRWSRNNERIFDRIKLNFTDFEKYKLTKEKEKLFNTLKSRVFNFNFDEDEMNSTYPNMDFFITYGLYYNLFSQEEFSLVEPYFHKLIEVGDFSIQNTYKKRAFLTNLITENNLILKKRISQFGINFHKKSYVPDELTIFELNLKKIENPYEIINVSKKLCKDAQFTVPRAEKDFIKEKLLSHKAVLSKINNIAETELIDKVNQNIIVD